MSRPLALAVLALAAATTPALAGATAWQELAPGVRIRMIAADTRAPDGSTMLALELDMPANTKTYWRVPGEGGIPAEIDISGSTGVSALDPVWPYPTIDHTGGYTDFVYYGPTVLPLTARLSGPVAEVRASVTLGVCSDICMPATANFALPLAFARPDLGQQLRIAQAVALVPVPWDGSGAPIGAVDLTASGDALVVPVASGDVDPGSVIADMGPTGALFGAPQKSPEGGVVTLPLLGGGNAGSLQGQTVRLTFLTPAGAFETTRVVGGKSSPAH